MIRRFALGGLFLILAIMTGPFLSFPSVVWAQEEDKAAEASDQPVEVVADNIQFEREKRKIIGQGNVVVTYKDVKLQSDRAEVYTDTKKAFAEGHVTIIDGNSSLSAERAEYDFRNRTGSLPDATGYQYPWYTQGERLEQVSRDEIRVQNGAATTCNLEFPHYEVTAKKVTVYPDDKIVLKNATVKVLGRKVFWLPYLTIPLDDRQSPIEIRTGYSDNYGFYVLTAKDFSLTKNVKLKGHVDYRTKRGIAGGVDVGYHVANFGRGKIITYLADDKRAPTAVASPDPAATDSNPFIDRREDTRYRMTLRHRTDFEPRTNLIVNWHELSDEFLIQEFFQREERKEARPRSQVILTRTRDDYGMFTEVAKRTNKFFSEIEKLPRLNFTWKNQPLFDTRFLYKHETQLTNFNKKIARSAYDEDVVRAETYHEIQRPFRVLDSRVKVTPFINGRQAFYSQNRFEEDNLSRTLLGYGFETRTRFQRPFEASTNFLGLDINRLRHIIEPIFRHNAIRVDTAPPGEIYQMDEFDALHKQDVFTLALDNRLQTKRKRNGIEQRVDVVSYNTYVNYELNGGRNGGSSATDWGHQVELRPYDWLLIETETIYDFTLHDIRESLFDVVFEPLGDKIRLILSHGFLRRDPSIPGSEKSNLVGLDLIVKLNERWKIGGYLRDELDSGTMQEWEIRATRDLHDFLLSFGINVRDSDLRGSEGTNKEAFVEFTMKAFPGVNLAVGNRSSIIRPRIGRYYGGSNAEEYFPSEYYGAF
jgi:hypothetical protein